MTDIEQEFHEWEFEQRDRDVRYKLLRLAYQNGHQDPTRRSSKELRRWLTHRDIKVPDE